MGIKRSRRRSGPALEIPEALLAALEAVHGPLDPARLAPAVARLSEGLTRTRGGFLAGYLRDPALRAAYGTYYLCANAPKAWPLLDSVGWPSPLRVLELGGGPGTGVAALWAWAQARGHEVEHTVTDVLPENLADARRLADALGAKVRLQPLDLLDLPREGVGPLAQQYDLVLGMNVVNELPPAADPRLARALSSWTAPDGRVAVIEPAAKEPSRRALALRDHLVGAGWRPRFPCPEALPCPALAAGEWCHGEWWFERPRFMAEIDRRVGTRREVLKATCFLLDRRATPCTGGLRVMSERHDEKGRSHLLACGPEALVRLERQRRDASERNADFADATRFDLLRVEGGDARGDRIRLGPNARCERA